MQLRNPFSETKFFKLTRQTFQVCAADSIAERQADRARDMNQDILSEFLKKN